MTDTPQDRDPAAEPTGPVEDDRLRLVFTCCHPALAPENRVALTLRLLGGLTVAEIAAAFLVPETTMAQRITRSKQKIKVAGIPYRIPQRRGPPRAARSPCSPCCTSSSTRATSARSGEAQRTELTAEAIRLVRQLREMVTGDAGARPAARGRRAAGADAAHRVAVACPGASTARWCRSTSRTARSGTPRLIDEGHRLVRGCLALNRPGPYQLQAAINAVHTDALDASMTDWGQVVALFDQLLARQSRARSVALNRAVAVAEVDGPDVALALVEPLALTSYHAWHATRADLLRRLRRYDEARAAYDGRSSWPATRRRGRFLRGGGTSSP